MASLCAVNRDGTTSFADLQAATDSKSTSHRVYFAFDLVYLNGENLTELPLLDRKERLRKLLKGVGPRSPSRPQTEAYLRKIALRSVTLFWASLSSARIRPITFGFAP